MKKAQKLATLTQALQGNVTQLYTLKRDQRQKVFLFIVDEVPEGWFSSPDTSDTPVKATYSLTNGTRVTDYLTYAQMKTMAKGAVLTILPDNLRLKRPA